MTKKVDYVETYVHFFVTCNNYVSSIHLCMFAVAWSFTSLSAATLSDVSWRWIRHLWSQSLTNPLHPMHMKRKDNSYNQLHRLNLLDINDHDSPMTSRSSEQHSFPMAQGFSHPNKHHTIPKKCHFQTINALTPSSSGIPHHHRWFGTLSRHCCPHSRWLRHPMAFSHGHQM